MIVVEVEELEGKTALPQTKDLFIDIALTFKRYSKSRKYTETKSFVDLKYQKTFLKISMNTWIQS